MRGGERVRGRGTEPGGGERGRAQRDKIQPESTRTQRPWNRGSEAGGAGSGRQEGLGLWVPAWSCGAAGGRVGLGCFTGLFYFSSVKHEFLFVVPDQFRQLEHQWHCSLLSGQPLSLGGLVVQLQLHRPLSGETLETQACEAILSYQSPTACQ